MKPLTPRSAAGVPLSGMPDWRLGQLAFTRVDNGTEPMNINGTPGGTADVLWNGTGAADTGGDWTHGGVGAETAGSMHSGTNGLDTGSAGKDAVTQFDNGSEIDVAATYATLQFWLNTRAYPNKSELQIEWLDSGNNKIGAALKVGDYITNFDIGVWQQVSIPIADFLLTADVQKLELKYAKVAGQQFWFDDFELLQSGGGGGPYVFRIEAPENMVHHIASITLVLAEEDSTWVSSGFANLSQLPNGVLIRHVDNEPAEPEVLWSINLRSNLDLMGRLEVVNDVEFADSERMLTFQLKPYPAVVEVTDQKVIEILIRDNLTTLNNLRAFAQYGLEDATP